MKRALMMLLALGMLGVPASASPQEPMSHVDAATEVQMASVEAAGSASVSCGGTAPAERTCTTPFTMRCSGLAITLEPQRTAGVVPYEGRIVGRIVSGSFDAMVDCMFIDGLATGREDCSQRVQGSCVSGTAATLTGTATGAGRWQVRASYNV